VCLRAGGRGHPEKGISTDCHNGSVRRLGTPKMILLAVLSPTTFACGAGISITNVPLAQALPVRAQNYPFYIGTQLTYVLPVIRAMHQKVSVLRVPSYDPVDIVTAQWPEPGAVPLGKHYTMYLFVSSGPVQGPRQVLPLAQGPPVSDECTQPTDSGPTGNSGPPLCPNGGVNVSAWIAYAELRLPVLSLGRTATRCQVFATFQGVGDAPEIGLTIPEMYQGYTLATAYYEWKLVVPDPAAAVQPGWEKNCPHPSRS
jgi:hypothetical protein